MMPNALQGYMMGQEAAANRKRNALLQYQVDSAPAEQDRRNKLLDLQAQAAQQGLDTGKFELDAAKNKQVLGEGIAAAGYVIESKAPKLEAEQRYPQIVQQLRSEGIDWDLLDDDDVREIASEYRNQLSSRLGVGPAPKPKQFVVEDGPRGSKIQLDPETGERKQIIAPDNTDTRLAPAQPRYQALTPDEVAAAGLPPGTSAQRELTSGKIDVLSKKDITGSLTPKDATTAKIKLNQVKVARQQLQNAREKFEAIKGTIQAGPGGQGRLPTEQGRLFDRAVDTMRGSITAITRVPGIGAMSDYETRLDQSKFPDRTDYENVAEEQLNQLDQLLSTVEQGYQDLLGGGQPPAAQALQKPPQQQIKEGAIARNPATGQRIQFRGGQWVPLAN